MIHLLHRLNVLSIAALTGVIAAPSLAQCNLSFGTPSTSPVAGPRSLQTGDFNQDGMIDALSLSPSTLTLFRGNGVGSFTVPTNTSVTSAVAMACGDFDGDGDLDVATTSVNLVSVYLNNGTGAFSLMSAHSSGGTNTVAIAAHDINEDGILDLLTLNPAGGTVGFLRGLGGTFASAVLSSTAAGSASAMTLGDWNLNGDIDIAICNTGTNTVSLYTGFGNGSFSLTSVYSTGANFPSAIDSGDLDNDGRLDLVIANSNSSMVSVLKATGSGTFASATLLGVDLNPRSVRIADVNGDNAPDILVSCSTSDTFIVRTNDGAGSFLSALTRPTFTAPLDLAAADINADGRKDLLVICSNGNALQAFLNTTVFPPLVTAHPQTQSVLAGAPATFSVAATGTSLSYQWRRNFINLANGGAISGATTPALSINPAAIADNLGQYDVVISNSCAVTTSRTAVLGVSNCDGDFNGDGEVDFFDYLDFVDAFSIGC